MLVTREQLQGVLSNLSKLRVISIDTETTGLSWSDTAFSIQIATETDEYVFDKRVIGITGLDAVRSFIRSFKGEAVYQNAKFDMHKSGATPRGTVSDIEVLARLVNNTHMSYRLADQAKRYGMHKMDEVAAYVKKHKITDWSKVPLEVMAPYAGHDARITYDLFVKYKQELDERSYPVWDMEQKLTKVCAKMESYGVHLDMEYVHKAKAYEERLIREAMARFRAMTGQEYDNSRSQLIKVFTEAGEEIPLTEKGNPSVDDTALSSFKSPVAKVVQEIRFYGKRVATYYNNFIKLADEQGIIHPDMRQAGTTTGRFSYREPNFQNIPKEDDEEDKDKEYVIRGCITPREGNILVSMDFKAQEYRLMLAYANEVELIGRVMAGHDVHQATADMLCTARSLAKNINFATLYGAGRYKIAEMTGLHPAEAGRMLDKYFLRLPNVERLIRRVPNTAKSRGYIYTWYGRKLHLPHADLSYVMTNHLIQGGCADITKIAMVNLSSEPIVLQIHDQLVFECPMEYARENVLRWKTTMENVFPEKNGIRMEVDITWSDKSLAERDMKPWT